MTQIPPQGRYILLEIIGFKGCDYTLLVNAIETCATLYARSNIAGKTLDVLHA